MENAIIAENLTKSFGATKAIHDISFTVKKGEVVGFLGPNGAGKSTTLRILSGLLPATSGSAYICRQSVAKNPKRVKLHIGYMPENNPLLEDMRVSEYLYYRACLKEIPFSERKDRVQEVLDLCDLSRTAQKKIIRTLSKGYRQRVGIADCLLGNPEVVIMDEPIIGLDPHQIVAIRELIQSLRGKMTIILSSHILPEIEASCDRVIIINRGHVVASGSPKELHDEFDPLIRYSITLKASLKVFIHELGKLDPTLEITEDWDIEGNKEGLREYIVESLHKGDIGDRLIQHFKGSEYELHEMKQLKPSLEDIFLMATKKSWKEEGF